MKKYFILALIPLLTNCGQKKTSLEELDMTTVTVESATSLLSGLADDQSGDTYALYQSEPLNKINLILNQAWASSCVRPIYSSCSNSARSQTYSSCQVGSTSLTMSGTASLSYSNSMCSLASLGSSVTRAYNVTFSGVRGGSLNISSQSATDYKGNSYGGGGRLTTQSGGWTAEILGKHKALSIKGVTVAQVSLRTLSPVNITGSLSRVSRVVNGGQIEVNYNRAQATAVIVPSNLQWSNTCCHPTSGTLAATWSGSRTGSSSITFTSCGQALVNENGQERNIELSYCE
ncbi:MAG: hypothetical protein ACK5W9_08095 [Bdellovibrionales bacterium]